MKKYLFTLIVFLFLGRALWAFQTTVNIAVIRVDFQKDSNALTTGDGRFMIDSVTATPYAIDPTPHNRTYFNDQLIAASNYFKSVSGGKVQLKASVFPHSLNGSYHLNHPMAFYNPNTSQDAIDDGVARLFADAVLTADSGNEIDFSQFDLVLVFHAGVGRDINLGIDETPQDIPSLYLNRDFIGRHLPDFAAGIPVNQDRVLIHQGIVLPETENQAGFSLALTGFITSNIGSYLGLYDLFSATEQTSGIGRFGLMDVGLLNASGLIPSPPSAFSRRQMGWADMQRVTGDETVSIRRRSASGQMPDLVEIPVSDDESYLLEYRGDPTQNLDSLQFVLSDGREELAGHMETLQTYFADQIEISDSSGVLLKVANYDLGLPGAGILLWHVDYSVIRNAEKGSINNNPTHRAVDLEEADGSQDIGQQYTLLDAGFQSELGTPLDFWYKDNPAPLYKNEFSASTIPAAVSYAGRADFGLTLKNFSSNHDAVMQFDVQRSGVVAGYPYFLQRKQPRAFIVGKPGTASRSLLYYVDSLGTLSMSVLPDPNIGGPATELTVGHVAPASHISMAFGDALDNGTLNTLWVVAGDSLYAFDPLHFTDGKMDTLFTPIRLQHPAVSAMAVYNGQGYVSDGSAIYRIEKNGSLQIIPTEAFVGNLVPGLTDLNLPVTPVTFSAAADNLEVRYDGGNNLFTILKDGQVFQAFNPADAPVGPVALAGLGGNGNVDILFNGKNKIWAYHINGALVTGFPYDPVLGKDDSLMATPTIIQAGKDFQIFSASSHGRLIGVDGNGHALDGFPRVSGGSVIGGPRFFPDQSAVGLLTENAQLYLWSLNVPAGTTIQELWNGPFGDPSNTARQIQIADLPVTATELVPQKTFYNYPNPNTGGTTTIRYYLSADADVRLRIFDPTGHKVREFDGPGNGRLDNEQVLDVSGLASGVYVCQIEAKNAQKTERKTIKIMVVH